MTHVERCRQQNPIENRIACGILCPLRHLRTNCTFTEAERPPTEEGRSFVMYLNLRCIRDVPELKVPWEDDLLRL